MKNIGDTIKMDLYDGSQGGEFYKDFFELKITDKNIRDVELPIHTSSVGCNIKEQKIVNYFFNKDGSVSQGMHYLLDNTPLVNTEGIYFCEPIKNK